MIYIRRPAGVSSGYSSHVPLAQLRLGLFLCEGSQGSSGLANTGQLACQVHYT